MTSIITKQNWKEFSGLRRVFWSASGIALSAVYDARQCDLDSSDGRWIASCELHNTLCNNCTYDLALLSAQYTENFCEDCANSAALAEETRASEAPRSIDSNGNEVFELEDGAILIVEPEDAPRAIQIKNAIRKTKVNLLMARLSLAQSSAIASVIEKRFDRSALINVSHNTMQSLIDKGIVERRASGAFLTSLGYELAYQYGYLSAAHFGYDNRSASYAPEDVSSAITSLYPALRAALLARVSGSYGAGYAGIKSIDRMSANDELLRRDIFERRYSPIGDYVGLRLTALGYAIASELGYLQSFEDYARSYTASASEDDNEDGAPVFDNSSADDDFFAALGLFEESEDAYITLAAPRYHPYLKRRKYNTASEAPYFNVHSDVFLSASYWRAALLSYASASEDARQHSSADDAPVFSPRVSISVIPMLSDERAAIGSYASARMMRHILESLDNGASLDVINTVGMIELRITKIQRGARAYYQKYREGKFICTYSERARKMRQNANGSVERAGIGALDLLAATLARYVNVYGYSLALPMSARAQYEIAFQCWRAFYTERSEAQRLDDAMRRAYDRRADHLALAFERRAHLHIERANSYAHMIAKFDYTLSSAAQESAVIHYERQLDDQLARQR